MTKATRLNIENVLNNLPAGESEKVVEQILQKPEILDVPWNLSPSKVGSMIRAIRNKLGFKSSVRTKSLDQTHHSMRSNIGIQNVEDAHSTTAGFKRTTDRY